MDKAHYLTISGAQTEIIKVKGSRFIAKACPVSGRIEAHRVIKEVRQKYYDATHNCYAYRIVTSQGDHSRFSDDGEPSGTAGKPILQAIESRNLVNVLVQVTRYFGGVKLGTGGLARAYGDAARCVLDQCEMVAHYLQTTYKLTYHYDLSNAVARAIERYQVQVVSSVYDTGISQMVNVRQHLADEFYDAITDATGGKIQLEKVADEEI
jgi:uncharacterized YigZ family protein